MTNEQLAKQAGKKCAECAMQAAHIPSATDQFSNHILSTFAPVFETIRDLITIAMEANCNCGKEKDDYVCHKCKIIALANKHLEPTDET